MVHTPGKEIMAQLGLDYVARKHSLALVALNLPNTISTQISSSVWAMNQFLTR